jgi:two-component system sensor histidine kinase ChvG
MTAVDPDQSTAVARPRNDDVVLGDDWIGPSDAVDRQLRAGRKRRGFLSLNSSPLARKIVTFNLIALAILVAGILYLNPSRDSLITQRADALATVSALVSDTLEARLKADQLDLSEGAQALISDLELRGTNRIFVYAPDGQLLAEAATEGTQTVASSEQFLITDTLDGLRNWALELANTPAVTEGMGVSQDVLAKTVGETALNGSIQVVTSKSLDGGSLFAVASPIRANGEIVGTIAITTKDVAMDRMLQREREQVLKIFLVAILVSIGLSLVLASLIANPLSDLADAVEVGNDRSKKGGVAHNRIRIPDLTARPDEIGRLSGALRGMVAALYERIESNEQFAADVSHEIKNPLASLRSAVGTLRVARRDDQRDRLLDVIDHDVRRLDRLVSDISNASRLDAELVKEEEESFDLGKMLQNLADYLGQEAGKKGVDFITDLPKSPVMIRGLEARLAQVFVNLISNATSFCEQGDAIRLWCRVNDSRVLVVVEDTGPGIPEQALTKVFKRFYSERPEGQFGNNSGLGLAISKQIIEAHGGVIWAENIRPTDADITSEPLGARFVVGMPL